MMYIRANNFLKKNITKIIYIFIDIVCLVIKKNHPVCNFILLIKRANL